MRKSIGLILGGGKGTRLFPLTQFRSKPAVPLAGKYRLIDIPISNCLNSGIDNIYVLTQFNSVSLHRHIQQAYQFDRFRGGFVELLAAQQTYQGTDWYQGTADAVRKNLRYIQQPGIEHVLVLSGDQLYRMNYADMYETHRSSGADVTIAAVSVSAERASAFGIMRLDATGRVAGFLEKPQTREELDIVRADPAWLKSQGILSPGNEFLASMGIYLFNRDFLVELLEKSNYQDFGREIFPMAIRVRKVQVHPFDGYWEDIGTIRSFYEANLALAGPAPPFDLAVEEAPIYSRARFLPPTRALGAHIEQSLIADGCMIGSGARIENSVIGVRCRIGRNATIRNSVLMGADFYEKEPALSGDGRKSGQIPVGIGDGSVIDGAIVDKNSRIGQNVRIQADAIPSNDCDLENVFIRDGIIVVSKEAVLADNWSLKQELEAIRQPATR